jgi:hypothetical protein
LNLKIYEKRIGRLLSELPFFVAEYVEEMREKKFTLSTIDAYLREYHHFFTYVCQIFDLPKEKMPNLTIVHLRQIRRTHIERYIVERREGTLSFLKNPRPLQQETVRISRFMICSLFFYLV